jgi:hypothetical protein
MKEDRLADRWVCERQNEETAPVCQIAQKRVGLKLGARCNASFAHHRYDCDVGQIGTGEAKISGAPARFRIQPGIVLRECEVWIVVDRNSRNARVFGARYWREG